MKHADRKKTQPKHYTFPLCTECKEFMKNSPTDKIVFLTRVS